MAVFLLKNEDAQCTRLIEGLTFRDSWGIFFLKMGQSALCGGGGGWRESFGPKF